jgi:O-antigen ligase
VNQAGFRGDRSGLGFLTEARLLALLIGFAPVIVLLLTWDPDGASSRTAMGIREYALPMLAAEGIVVGLAALSGLARWMTGAPKIILAAAAGWLAIALYTAIFVAVDPRLSVFLTSIWVLHGLFAAAVAFLCRTARLDSSELAIALMAGFIVYALAAAWFGLQLDQPINWVTDMPGLGNLRRVAAYATIIAGLSVGALIWPRRWLALAAATAAFFTAFWTGSRATALAVAVAVVAAALVFPGARNKRLLVGVLLAELVGFALAFAFPAGPGAGNDELRAVLEMSDNGRFRVWSNCVHAIMNSPWLGYGEGQTAHVLPDNPNLVDDFQAHAHNLVLQWMMAWGLVGTALIAVIAGWLAGLLYQAGRTAEGLPFVLAAGAITAHAMVDGALYDVAPVFLFAACIGAGLAQLANRPESRQERIGSESRSATGSS